MVTWASCRKMLGITESAPSAEPLQNIVLENIAHDGRLATQSHVFAPLQHSQESVTHFIHQAIKRGCKAIIVNESMAQNLPDVPRDTLFIVPDFHQALAVLYPLFYPHLPTHRVAITGTDGKTSTAHFLHQLWTLTGISNAAMGTMGFFCNPSMAPPLSFPDGMTTPPKPLLYTLLSWCKAHGMDHVAFEASSHALAQSRLEPLRVSVGMMTNFAQDHLDYHSNLYGYWQAKWRLFTHCMVENSESYALIHNSIPLSLSDRERLSPTISMIRYGHHAQVVPGVRNTTYRIIETTPQGQRVVFQAMDEEWESHVPLIGGFQISNVLGALTAFICAGGNVTHAIPALSQLKPVLGRMEHICMHNGANIYVDYAHTPQGLSLALQSLRPCTSGQLGIVFGCGGARDALKRPLMGQVAALYSDWAIVTDDNPRTEDPVDIRQHILVGCPDALSIGPRSSALEQALKSLKPGDSLLIAGKGHERTQAIGDHVLPHSDQDWVREYCRD